jgi:glycosyltransferase involved in cell wall biosynthesis
LAYDAEHFYPRSRKKTSQPYFLYLGRHDPYKNLQGLIAAFAELKNKPDYQLWIAGSFDQRFTPQLKQQVLELNIEAQVKFLDYVSYEDLPSIMSNAIALVFPTLWEGFGLPALEAIACGTPVITSNLASLPEVIGDAGAMCDAFDTNALAGLILNGLENEKWRQTAIKKGLRRSKKFSWRQCAQETIKVYHTALNVQ